MAEDIIRTKNPFILSKRYMKELIKQTIEGYKAKKLILQDTIKEYVQDKSLPLSDRWEIFCSAGDIIPKKGSVVRFKSWEVQQLIANSYLRYQLVDLISLIQDMENEDIEIGYIGLEDFKEEILDKFICSFNLDW